MYPFLPSTITIYNHLDASLYSLALVLSLLVLHHPLGGCPSHLTRGCSASHALIKRTDRILVLPVDSPLCCWVKA